MKIWSTPQPVFDKLNEEFRFYFDVCADRDNAKCKNYFTREDGLKKLWTGVCFLNPPYGREIGEWMLKALYSANIGHATVVCLIPSRTNSPWWHDYVMRATEIRFIRSKLSFTGGNGVPFWGNAIVVFRSGQVGGEPKVSSWIQPKSLSENQVKGGCQF